VPPNHNVAAAEAPPLLDSVHLCAYPEHDPALSEPALEQGMDQARRVVSLGHGARKERGLRVRQPLPRVTLVTRSEAVRAGAAAHLDVILEELNVKALEWAEDETQFVSYEYKGNFAALGPRFGKHAPKVAKWLSENAAEVTRQLLAHEEAGELLSIDGEARDFNWVELELDGAHEVVDERAFETILREKPDTAAQRDGDLLLVLDTHITPELRQEGLAREVVSRLQAQRKALDLDYVQRIRVSYQAEGELACAIEAQREFIAGEVLAEELQAVDSLAGEHETVEIDGLRFAYRVA
jgi:isoleucyl-tRNA synthetase